MNKVQQLKQQIADIESSVNEDMSKEEVYDKLIISYNHHKDIIALLESPEMEIDTSTSQEEVKALETRLRDAENHRQNLADKLQAAEETIRTLESWKDGANLEGEQMKAKITSLQETLQKREDTLDEIAELAK